MALPVYTSRSLVSHRYAALFLANRAFESTLRQYPLEIVWYTEVDIEGFPTSMTVLSV